MNQLDKVVIFVVKIRINNFFKNKSKT